MAKKIIGTITLGDGTVKDVIDKKGRYFVCKDSQHLVSKYTLTVKKGVKKNAESELSERDATAAEREEHECDR